jgi:mediator of RNA polymerase II transcription subunit 31
MLHRYPHCLYILDLLQHKSFREQLASSEAVDLIHEQQFYHWQLYRNKRMLKETYDA